MPTQELLLPCHIQRTQCVKPQGGWEEEGKETLRKAGPDKLLLLQPVVLCTEHLVLETASALGVLPSFSVQNFVCYYDCPHFTEEDTGQCSARWPNHPWTSFPPYADTLHTPFWGYEPREAGGKVLAGKRMVQHVATGGTHGYSLTDKRWDCSAWAWTRGPASHHHLSFIRTEPASLPSQVKIFSGQHLFNVFSRLN